MPTPGHCCQVGKWDREAHHLQSCGSGFEPTGTEVSRHTSPPHPCSPNANDLGLGTGHQAFSEALDVVLTFRVQRSQGQRCLTNLYFAQSHCGQRGRVRQRRGPPPRITACPFGGPRTGSPAFACLGQGCWVSALSSLRHVSETGASLAGRPHGPARRGLAGSWAGSRPGHAGGVGREGRAMGSGPRHPPHGLSDHQELSHRPAHELPQGGEPRGLRCDMAAGRPGPPTRWPSLPWVSGCEGVRQVPRQPR